MGERKKETNFGRECFVGDRNYVGLIVNLVVQYLIKRWNSECWLLGALPGLGLIRLINDAVRNNELEIKALCCRVILCSRF